jgi:dTDP-4-amino-4,6-dideoxygalactose transaminase
VSHAWPRWPPDDERTRQAPAVAVLAGRWAISGPVSGLPSFVDAAAGRVAQLAGRRFAVLASSGSSAIVLALQALGVGPGCRVLTPAMTWVGCATAVLRTGATPVFVDANDANPCMSSQLDGVAIGPADAVLAVHTFASQVDILALRECLPGVPIVEDCSHCHGAVSVDGRPLGSLGDLSIFSFQATKVLPAGEGGAVVTDDEDMAARLFALATDSRRLVPHPPLDALNRLEPAGILHGANHAMSEFSGAVLWAQLLSMPDLAARRADGLRFFADQLGAEGGSLVFDRASAASGGFYGVPFLPAHPWLSGVARIIDEVRSACGARLDRVYPPVPSSPLYRPETVSTYRRGEILTPATHRAPATHPAEALFPNSMRWHREGVVLPHALFLAEEPALTALAETMNRLAGRPQRQPHIPPRPAIVQHHREVCVVVVTSGQRDTLTEALGSLKEQTYSGPCSVLLLCDNQDCSADRVPDLVAAAALPRGIPVRIVSLMFDVGTGDNAAFARVARLRNAALGWVTAPLVAFLDDDNAWEPEHLSSLTRLLDQTRTLAVHSWRRLLGPDGKPHVPHTFPWLRDPQRATARFAVLRDAGVFGHDSEIVRDRISVPVGGCDYGMVDMGELLFDRRLFDVMRFDTNWTADEIIDCVGEDDKLVQRLRELLIPVHCTEQATLRYRLGGFTNAFVAASGRTPWCPVFGGHDPEENGV